MTQLATRNTDEMDATTISDAFVKSGMFPGIRDAAQAFVKIQAGRELGFAPFASMKGVHIIQGNTALSANLMASRIKSYANGKYNYKVVEHTDEACAIEFTEKGVGVCGTSRFTMKDAQAAGLGGKDNWKKFARNMLFARALSNGARWYCADAFGGSIYVPEELGADVNGEGEVIEVSSKPAVVSRSDALKSRLLEAYSEDAAFVEKVRNETGAEIVRVDEGTGEVTPAEPETPIEMDEFECRELLQKQGLTDAETDLILSGLAKGKLKELAALDTSAFYGEVVNRVTADPAKFKAGARKKLAESAA
jgi:hypothetical protein